MRVLLQNGIPLPPPYFTHSLFLRSYFIPEAIFKPQRSNETKKNPKSLQEELEMSGEFYESDDKNYKEIFKEIFKLLSDAKNLAEDKEESP